MQLSTQFMEQHYHNQEQTKHILQLNQQIIKQNNQISEQHFQLEQLNIVVDILVNKNTKVGSYVLLVKLLLV